MFAKGKFVGWKMLWGHLQVCSILLNLHITSADATSHKRPIFNYRIHIKKPSKYGKMKDIGLKIFIFSQKSQFC